MTDELMLAFLAYFPVMLVILVLEKRPVVDYEATSASMAAVELLLALGGIGASLGTVVTLLSILNNMVLLQKEVVPLSIFIWVFAFVSGTAAAAAGFSKLISRYPK